MKGRLKMTKSIRSNDFTVKCDNAKLFKTAEFSLKCHGSKKEKLQIMKGNEKKYIQSVLEANAQKNGVKIVEKRIKSTLPFTHCQNKTTKWRPKSNSYSQP